MMDHVKDFANILTAATTLTAGLLAALKYLDYNRTRREKLLQIQAAFNGVVTSLSSQGEVERMAGAILLRRFFDARSEVGTAGIPYAREAVNVSAAILRGQATGNFQKLLADGLAFAPSLVNADLQRTNLQFAYLGSRTGGDGTATWTLTTDLSKADFYRADLSRGSLKNAKAHETVFYQARMHGTVLTGAELIGANFFEADLKGAKFDRALLSGAKFNGARNVPPGIADKLNDKGEYIGADPFQAPPPSSESAARVFISKPGCLNYQQQECITSLLMRLESAGMVPQSLERAEYPNFGAFGEVQRIMSDCAGAVIFGFRQLDVREGIWRPGTIEEKQVQAQSLPTPWNQIEAGIASTLGLPLLVIFQHGVGGGVFDADAAEHQVYRALLEDGWQDSTFARSFNDWSSDVRDRSRISAKPASST